MFSKMPYNLVKRAPEKDLLQYKLHQAFHKPHVYLGFSADYF